MHEMPYALAFGFVLLEAPISVNLSQFWPIS